MKNILFTLSLVLLSFSLYSQIGSVQSNKTISNGLNGFGNELDGNDRFGAALINIGDVNNDGVNDLAVGSFRDDDGGGDKGAVYILFMDTSGSVDHYQKISMTSGGLSSYVTLGPGDLFGTGLASCNGDFNGDGIEDIMVAAQRDPSGGSQTGAVYLIYLDTNGTVKGANKISKLVGYGTGGLPLQSGSNFGCEIACLGDIDGNNVNDFAVGAYTDNGGGYSKGAVWVLKMKANGTVKSHFKIYDGITNFNAPINNQDYFGVGVGSLGDRNNDGIPDLVVGAYYDGSGNQGAIYTILLDTNGVKSYTKIANGLGGMPSNSISNNFGISARGISDFNGDGVDDICVGASYGYGSIYILYMNNNLTVSSYTHITASQLGSYGSNRIGGAVSELGDLNHDGNISIAIGATYYNSSAGSVYNASIKAASFPLSISKSNLSCYNDSTGSAKVVPSGGTTPYTYLWSNGATTDSIFGLGVGTYTVTVTDSTNKHHKATIYITSPSAFSYTHSSNSSICNGVSTNIFAAANGGTGSKNYHWNQGLGNASSHTISPQNTTTYTVYATDANNCSSDTANIIISVNPLPTTNFSGLNVAYCSNDNSATLMGSPGGGSFSGPGVAGSSFVPANANTGINQVIYSYTDNNGCIGKDTNSTNVFAAPNIQFSGITSAYCANDADFTLSSKVSPSGGSFWVNNISSTVFSPSTLGPGTYKIKYSVTNAAGCSDVDSTTTFINPVTAASFTGLASAYCENSTVVTLSGSPSGGSFSGTGISGSSFNPANAGLGSVSVDYSYTNFYGCTDTATNSTTINAITALTVSTAKTVFCNSDAAVSITTTPASGTLSGPGVNNSAKTFSPSTSGTGNKTIIYTFTNPYGCTSVQTHNVTVNAPASISISGLASTFCLNNDLTTITGTPSGGSFFGSGISGSSFNPSAAGVGTHSIAYRYDNGCVDTAFQNVQVYALPSVSISGLSSAYCANDNAVNLIGNPSGGSFSGSGINGVSFSPASAGVGSHNISYISAADSHGCIDTAIQAVTINSLPNISFGSLTADQCVNSTAVSLSASPSGGSFAGANVSGSLFYPTTAGAGSHDVYYALTDANSCSNSDTFTFIVHALPSISFNVGSSCANISSMSLSASPSGGSFSGNYVSGNAFSPLNAGAGTHELVYSYTDSYSCSNTDTQYVLVNTLPNVSFSMASTDFCDDGSSVSLSAIPSGGSFSGNGISGSSFNPVTAGIGTHNLIYSFTDANLCSNTDTNIVIVHSWPNISFASMSSDKCVNGSNVALNAFPTGGSFSGNYVYSNSYFSPSNAGVGNHKIYYTSTSPYGCVSSDSFSFIVRAVPNITFNVGSSCSNISSMSLSANPSGGSFSGANVSGSIFSPSTAGIGSHPVMYSYTDSYNCTNIDTQNIIVNSIPNVVFNMSSSDYCSNGIPISLIATPAGGSFAGSGVSGNTFSPAVAGIGSYDIIYSFTDANLCSNTDTNTMVVHGLPSISFSNYLSTNCINNPSDTITAIPFGGSFTGAGITDSVFNPYSAGVGNHQVFYSFTDSYNCSNNDSIIIQVFANPTVSFTGLNSQYCSNDSADTLIGSPLGGSFSGIAVMSSVFYPNLATIGSQNIIYSFTDANNCSASSSVNTMVNAIPFVDAGVDTLIPCSSTGAVIGENSYTAYTYLWSPYAGLSSPFVSNPTANPWVNTVYTLLKTDINTQCSNSDSVSITLPTLPIVNISGDTILCFGDSLHLSASGASNLLWKYNISGSVFDYLPLITQFISVVGIDSNNCKDFDSVLVMVYPNPIPNLGPDLAIFDMDSAVLNPGNFSSYIWNTGSTDPSVTVYANSLSPGNYSYSVEVVSQDGCRNSDTLVISITTGIGEYKQDLNIKVYPNPSSDWVYLDFYKTTNINQILLFDGGGKLLESNVLNSEISNYKLNVSHLAKGKYYLQILMDGQKKTIPIFVQ